ncbi:MAG: hypothetical protein EKK39_11880 [Sphingobacteriales bacterium]|nr:MAG: hypothetical protein EKK39_11880 [Sphingobacteriales bacterium]
MWIHESFANYAEALYVECQYGKQAGEDYVIGCRRLIRNDRPIIGHYGVNDEGSEDMYYKGGNMLNMIRHIIGNDSLWRAILRGLNQTFWHQTVTSRQIEQYIIQKSKSDLQPVFDQYLRTTQIPELEYVFRNDTLWYRWTNVIPDFHMPVRVFTGNHPLVLHATTNWQQITLPVSGVDVLKIDRNFYVNSRKLTQM